MSKFSNTHRKTSTIKVGDKVYLKVRQHKQTSMPTRIHPKLAARYYGPFLVVKQIGAVAFQLQLPDNARIHPVFHVSQLKLAIKEHSAEPQLPEEIQEPTVTYTPEKILDRRTITRQGNQVQQVLIQWKHLSTEEATWEDKASLRNQFPNLNLEDKVVLEGDEIVRPLQYYVRRRKQLGGTKE